MKNKIILLFLAFFIFSAVGYSQVAKTITFNIADLNQLKQESASDLKIKTAKASLIKTCNQILANKKMYSVTYNSSLLPGANKNDYSSYAAYMWPNPNTKDGFPYILKDGQRNRYSEKVSDQPVLDGLANDIMNLGVGYFYTGDESYVQWATTLLKTFFVDRATRMNPNLNFSQVTPGKNNTGGSIMEAVILVDVMDGTQFMRSSKNFSPSLSRELDVWFSDLLDWIENSPKGKINSTYKNNRSTYYTLLRSSIAMFTNDRQLASKIFKAEAFQRVRDQISSQGVMEKELTRATPLAYVKFNLKAFRKLNEIGNQLGFDLMDYEGPNGESLKKAFEWLDKYKDGKERWNYSSEVGIASIRRTRMQKGEETLVRFSPERFSNYLEELTSLYK